MIAPTSQQISNWMRTPANNARRSQPIMEPPATGGGFARLSPPAGIQNNVTEADGNHWNEARVIQSVRMRFNPIRNLTPDLLSLYLDQFRIGYLRNLVITWDAMERRDYQIKICRPKRLKSVARHGYEVITIPNIAPSQEGQAAAQKRYLQWFYDNLTATDALEPDHLGGFSLLVNQMMDAMGKYYSVHEIVWQPKPGGLTAEFRWCPLYWFETTRGRLRFLENEFALYGNDMPEGEWMVTVGDGLMEACSVCYIYKHVPIRFWLANVEKFGMPAVVGKTDAPPGSEQWDSLKDAVSNYGQELAAICNRNEDITLVDLKSQGSFVGETLIEKMDRAITQLWRGGDLGTMGGQGAGTEAKGVPLQAGETELLETDDALLIEETLKQKVSKHVISYKFGPDAPVLAYLRLGTVEKDRTAQDLAIDQFLLNAGAPLELRSTLERYGRSVPEPGEELLEAPVPVAPEEGKSEGGNPKSEAANDQSQISILKSEITPAARALLAEALAAEFKSLVAKGQALLAIEDEEKFKAAAKSFMADLDKFEAEVLQHPGAVAEVLVKAQVAALADGLVKAHEKVLATKTMFKKKTGSGKSATPEGGVSHTS